MPSTLQNLESANGNDTVENSSENVLNKRSEVLAMALGVQIKTGEDPPTGEIKISGFSKKNQTEISLNKEVDSKVRESNARLFKLASQSALNDKTISKTFETENKRNERNKFETEKPRHFKERQNNSRKYDVNRRYSRNAWTSYERYRRPRFRNDYYSRSRRNQNRSSRRSRSYSRTPPRRKGSRRSRSKERKNRRSRSKSHKSSREKSKDKDKKVETEAEKIKRRAEQILLLKKKMEEIELLGMKKKKEEETREKQVFF